MTRRLSWGAVLLSLDLEWAEHVAPRWSAVDLDGTRAALGGRLPVAEVLTVEHGHELASDRLMHGWIGPRLRYAGHATSTDAHGTARLRLDFGRVGASRDPAPGDPVRRRGRPGRGRGGQHRPGSGRPPHRSLVVGPHRRPPRRLAAVHRAQRLDGREPVAHHLARRAGVPVVSFRAHRRVAARGAAFGVHRHLVDRAPVAGRDAGEPEGQAGMGLADRAQRSPQSAHRARSGPWGTASLPGALRRPAIRPAPYGPGAPLRRTRPRALRSCEPRRLRPPPVAPASATHAAGWLIRRLADPIRMERAARGIRPGLSQLEGVACG